MVEVVFHVEFVEPEGHEEGGHVGGEMGGAEEGEGEIGAGLLVSECISSGGDGDGSKRGKIGREKIMGEVNCGQATYR